jgi:hypothetical protein
MQTNKELSGRLQGGGWVWSGKREENGPEGFLLVHILFPYSLPLIGSLPWPLLFRSYISPLFPYLVTSAPEDGNIMFL